MQIKNLSIVAVAAAAAVFAALVGCAPSQTVKPSTEEELQAKRDSAQQYYSIGASYFQQNNFESALLNFERALDYDSTYYEVYVAVGATYRKMRDAVPAEEYYRKAMKIDPKKPKAYEGLGDLFLSQGKDSAALAVYQEGLSHDSSLVDLYNGSAEVYVKRNQMEKADEVYQEAMRRFPDDVSVQRLWSDFLYKQKRYAEAVKSLGPLVQRFPTVSELREKLADCHIELKQYDKAIAQLDTVLQGNPNRDQTALRLGAVYLQSGKTRQAIQQFDALIAKDSTAILPRVFKAEALMKRGSFGSAEDVLQKVLRMDPGMAQAHVDLGDIRQRQADEQRGSNPAATPTSKLKRAKALYEEAKSHYNRGMSDPGLRSYANAKAEYVDKALQAVDKELFVRE
jgi:Tfp pilus assembly protein PilF